MRLGHITQLKTILKKEEEGTDFIGIPESLAMNFFHSCDFYNIIESLGINIGVSGETISAVLSFVKNKISINSFNDFIKYSDHKCSLKNIIKDIFNEDLNEQLNNIGIKEKDIITAKQHLVLHIMNKFILLNTIDSFMNSAYSYLSELKEEQLKTIGNFGFNFFKKIYSCRNPNIFSNYKCVLGVSIDALTSGMPLQFSEKLREAFEDTIPIADRITLNFSEEVLQEVMHSDTFDDFVNTKSLSSYSMPEKFLFSLESKYSEMLMLKICNKMISLGKRNELASLIMCITNTPEEKSDDLLLKVKTIIDGISIDESSKKDIKNYIVGILKDNVQTSINEIKKDPINQAMSFYSRSIQMRALNQATVDRSINFFKESDELSGFFSDRISSSIKNLSGSIFNNADSDISLKAIKCIFGIIQGLRPSIEKTKNTYKLDCRFNETYLEKPSSILSIFFDNAKYRGVIDLRSNENYKSDYKKQIESATKLAIVSIEKLGSISQFFALSFINSFSNKYVKCITFLIFKAFLGIIKFSLFFAKKFKWRERMKRKIEDAIKNKLSSSTTSVFLSQALIESALESFNNNDPVTIQCFGSSDNLEIFSGNKSNSELVSEIKKKFRADVSTNAFIDIDSKESVNNEVEIRYIVDHLKIAIPLFVVAFIYKKSIKKILDEREKRGV